ncbi:uncharacterized protein LOC130749945 [Actinidia eriantha]|uniref:uncharacterized protein LOC130749945 n=1 Tax=Actinidia eriantha TaxID=165200 RepID=UPI00258662A1|nr:uncharacterized protein LOC130749945 [Actinidia eriantha]
MEKGNGCYKWSDDKESSFKEEAEPKEVSNLCLMAHEEDNEVCPQVKSMKDHWYLDSGCSRHITGDKAQFTSLKPKDGGLVTFGDNSKGKIIGIGSLYPGGITRVKSHLSGVKGRDIKVCTKVPNEVQAAAFLAIGAPNKKAKTTGSSSNFEVTELSSQFLPSLSKSLHQSTMPEMCKKMDKSSVDKLLTKQVILNNIAFNVVQTPSFITFVKGVAEFGPTYKLPSYSTLRTKLVPDSRIEVEAYVANVKMSWIKTGCTLMSDIWSDMKQRAFINIIAYSPRGVVFMNAFEISKEKKTGLYLRDIMSSVVEDVGPDHVVQFVTDNATNFQFAGDMLIGKYPRMYKTKCAAHGMQLLLKDIYSEIQWVKSIIDDAKLILKMDYVCLWHLRNGGDWIITEKNWQKVSRT